MLLPFKLSRYVTRYADHKIHILENMLRIDPSQKSYQYYKTILYLYNVFFVFQKISYYFLHFEISNKHNLYKHLSVQLLYYCTKKASDFQMLFHSLFFHFVNLSSISKSSSIFSSSVPF